jgi:exonuclease SbcC
VQFILPFTAKNNLPQYDEFEVLKSELADKQSNLSGRTELQSQLKSQLNHQSKALVDMKGELDALKDAGLQRERLINKKKELEERKQKLAELENNLLAYEKVFNELEEAQKDYSGAAQKADHLYREYNGKNKAYLDEQAGILAQNLVEGEKCPVCGSTVHPSPAGLREGAPSETDVNKAKDAYEKAQSKAADLSANAGKLFGQADAKKTEIINTAALILGECDFSAINSSIETHTSCICSELDAVESSIDLENDKIKRKTDLEALIPEQETAIKDIETAISENDLVIAAIDSNIKSLSSSISKLASSLIFESKSKAQEHVSSLENEKEEMQSAYDKAQTDYNECRSSIDDLMGSIKAFTEQLKDTEVINVDDEKARQVVVNAKKAAISDSITQITTRISTNSTALKNINTQSGNLIGIEAKWMWVKALSNTANGNISGKEKIMLETYIQMTYFDRIIARANTRFMVMSGGQYELKRRIEANNNRSQSGLELDVIDHYNGTERNVKTLSGGESFKASLSLALGLSDEIQSSAGGVRLDTMFVDEGFGSLDEESLRHAINALIGLTEGNRLVGIISHVSELKDRIERQLIVTKEKSGGSRVHIV